MQIKGPSGIEKLVPGPKPNQILKTAASAQTAAQPPVPSLPPPDTKSEAQQKFESGLSLAKQGRNAEALAAFRDAVRLNPDLTEAQFSLGVLLARQGKAGYSEAMRHFLEVLRINPRDVDALINVSNLLEAELDFAASVAAMQKAVGFAQEKTELYVMLGQKQHKATQYL